MPARRHATHLFPDAATIAALPSEAFAMPRARGAALARTAAAIRVAMRALGDPDAWLPTDVGVRRGLARTGAEAARAERWRPWRSYALMHLWAVLGDTECR
jgi:AraC family transcriptional regulator of adaptative response / DNA-3-methyladenine glycosylase II